MSHGACEITTIDIGIKLNDTTFLDTKRTDTYIIAILTIFPLWFFIAP